MNRSPLVWLVLALAGWIAVTGRCADVQIAEALAEAGVHERAAEVAAAQRDSAHAENARLIAAVDSAKVSEERAQAVADSVTRDVALRSSRALRAAQATSDTLRASLTATQAALLTRTETAYQAVIAAKDEQIGALESQVATLYDGIGARDLLIVGMGEEMAALDQAATAYRIRGDLATSYARSQAQKGVIYRVLATGGAGKVCYDAINDGSTGLAVGSCAVAVYAAVSP